MNDSITCAVRRIPYRPSVSVTVIIGDHACAYARRVGSYLRRFAVLTGGEQLLVLLDVKIIGTRKVGTTGELERKFGIVERAEDIGDDRLLVDADR